MFNRFKSFHISSLLVRRAARVSGRADCKTPSEVRMKRLLYWVPFVFIAFSACAPLVTSTTRPSARPGYTAQDSSWVVQTLARLTLRQKAAQLVIPRIGGAFMPADGDAWVRAHDWVARQGVGGLIATIGPPLEAALKFNMLQQAADVPLLITADMEHGPGQLLNGGMVLPYGLDNGSATRFPPAMAIGATGDERFAYELGRITALEARAVGVHMNFAPVVDVNNNPANPIINTRSYGADPRLVARMAAAHIRGLQEHGMLATAKHFPGHGDTGTDSHVDLPVITVDEARADSVELLPYRAAIEVGVAAIMSAHISFPALTGDSLPATLNPRLMDGLLRQELGFNGLIVTDALDMGAIVKGYGNAVAPVMALEAGADLLLQVMPEDVALVIDAIVAAVRTGRLTEERIDHSVRKLLERKMHLGLHRERLVDLERIPYALGTRDHVAWADKAAEKSITLVRDRDGLLPIRARSVLSIVYAGDPNPFAGRTFQGALTDKVPGLVTAMLGPSSESRKLDAVRALARNADVVIFAPFIGVSAGKGELAIAEPVGALIKELSANRPVVVTSFGNPYVLAQFPDVSTYVVAWGQWDAPQRAAARALTGQIPITGRLPIAIPPSHALGDGIKADPVVSAAAPSSPLRPRNGTAASRMLVVAPAEAGMDPRLDLRVDSIVRIALLEGAAPGAAVAVGRHGRLVHLEGYGRLDTREGFAAVTDSTIYDVASMTKIVATTTAAMILVDEGRLDLDAPVQQYLPEWSGSPAKEKVTVRNLLLHDAGLPPFIPLYQQVRGRDAYLRRIVDLPFDYEPGTKTVYSDFGPILLAFIIERITGQTLDVFTQDRVFAPLGMRDTGFNPLWWVEPTSGPAVADGAGDVLASLRARIAPSEMDTIWRFRHVEGTVHDENAYAIGGVAGHAGLFSSARDLSVFAQMMLNGGVYDGHRVVREETVRAFTRRQSNASSRALGWDTPMERSSAGDYFPSSSFGHTGFTGTSIWIDPERDLFVILLTNRVNPTRENQRHAPLRRDVANAVQSAIRDAAVIRRVDYH
jgi:beta-N-acetylhexosaminidase